MTIIGYKVVSKSNPKMRLRFPKGPSQGRALVFADADTALTVAKAVAKVLPDATLRPSYDDAPNATLKTVGL